MINNFPCQPQTVPPLIDRSTQFRCSACGALSDVTGQIIEPPMRLIPVALPAPSSALLTEAELRERRNTVGNLLAEFAIFTRDHTPVVQVRDRVQQLVSLLDDLYAPVTSEPEGSESSE